MPKCLCCQKLQILVNKMKNATLENLVSYSRLLYELPNSKFHHLSFILRNGIVSSFGWNDTHKTHPLALKYGTRHSSIHSELQAIIRFKGWISDLRKTTLVNVRLGAKGQALLAKPCVPCQKMLVSFGIKKVFYTNQFGQFEVLKCNLEN